MCLHCHAQCDETNSFCSMDRLSELPDEIIIYILSFLKLKEAARTSVLSRRYWGHLWKFASSSLDFDDSSLQYLRKKSFFKTLPGIDRDRYVSWVNYVLRLHQAHTIDGFKVCFPLDEEYNKLDIDNWILFSLRKNVKRLSLDFNPIFQKVYRGYYTLPTKIPHGYSLDSLTNLCLSYVEVTGKVLNYILSNCPCIEALHVESSASLVNLKPSRPLLKLKHLEILRCVFLKEIEISAVNLVSFKYFGLKIMLRLGDVPNLVDVSVEGLYASYFVQKCCPISSYLSQLQTIVLDVDVEVSDKNTYKQTLMIVNSIVLFSSSFFPNINLCLYECAYFSWFNFSEVP